jgi:hypothetical protein
LSSFFFGMLGGIVSWLMTWFILQPLSRFFSLRDQAAVALARYEGQVDPNPDVPPPNEEWLAERKRAYEDCGAALAGFAASNPGFAVMLYSPGRVGPRYYAHNAGAELLTLSGVNPGTDGADQLRESIRSALKLSDGMPRKRRPR